MAYTVACRITLTRRLPLKLSDQGEYRDKRSALVFRGEDVLKRRYFNAADRGKGALVDRHVGLQISLNMKDSVNEEWEPGRLSLRRIR